ncbi:hypothetical protein E0E54_01085 [Azotobacter chroococcum]|uniref:NACHT domain-containing protein n=1 Tax=Azotobacter chroococcum TaxID=353 RepID=UPI00103D4AF7|nr:hypothetical protein [Azotobacter chroococcum]TBW40195.1 hypothetical protein E0E54_01085 [Azotobacter chroococcum]
MALHNYFPRHLSFTDDQSQRQIADETQLLAVTVPKIVLGEPGMGKSALISEIGHRLGVQAVSAIRFMHHRNPASCVVAGKPLLIDGLDEAMARHDGDAVDLILAQLEGAGSPDFILSCRAREWQSRSVTNLRQIYGVEPVVFTIEPFSREEAHTFLAQRHFLTDPERVLMHLDSNGISELYRNPLTLEMMGKVAEHDAALPATRGALFERVCTLLWPEHDSERQDGGLGAISEAQALSAAGAVMAGLLLAGAESVSLSGPSLLQEGDVRLVDLAALPGADAARAIFSSKMFHSIGVGRAKPIHRVIAEFLGARWLAQQATSSRAQRRLLAQLQGSGAVPASLRGLHAWLAFHSVAMSKVIIVADPFGVLRYGDASNLTADQADCMFDALKALAVVDPYFRSQDWDSHTATGLMIPHLRSKIKTEIASPESNAQLRSLLIEGLNDSPIACELGHVLESIVLSTNHFLRERIGAAEALMPHRGRAWWQHAVTQLHDQCVENSILLARRIIEIIECDVKDEFLVAILLAELGITLCPLPRAQATRVHTTRHFDSLVDVLPLERVRKVLDLLSEHAQLLGDSDWQQARDFCEVTSLLIVRAIDESATLPNHAMSLWNWLGLLKHRADYPHGGHKLLQERLNARDELRRAIQEYGLYVARPKPTIWESEHFDLNPRMVGLSGRPTDIMWFLERLAQSDNRDQNLRQDWCDLMQLGFQHGTFDSDLRSASNRFQRGDAQLEAFVRRLENPKKLPWQRMQERQAAKRERKKLIKRETDRRVYRAHREVLRAGELRAVLHPAQVYLGLAYPPPSDLSPTDRIATWLGIELSVDVMDGFEAVLHRSDVPTPVEISQGFAEGQTWNICFPFMAGLLARHRTGQGFSDLSVDAQSIGLLLCLHFDSSICFDSDLPALREALEQHVIPTATAREDFARLWIEPSLAAGASSVTGLYKLAHDDEWKLVGATLAPDWLMRFPNVPDHIELELVDCLTYSGALNSLAVVAEARSGTTFRDVEHLLGWLAIDVLLRFETVLPDLSGIGIRNPEFIWFLRNRFELERRGIMLPCSVAQAKWIVSQFRAQWPYSVLEGSGSGNTNSYDATDFLRAMISRIASDTSAEAKEALQELISEPFDSYSNLIRHMTAEQRQKCAEEDFSPLSPGHLGDLLAEGPPSNADDLKSLVLEELWVAQRMLIGDDIDQVRDFWNDAGIPYDENRCRDRLTAMIGPELMRYEVQRITEADMPKTKRADLAFACGRVQLPMEVKGQWHDEVWQAASDQLDLKYLIDWRSEQRGIYCVLWFGDLRSDSGRRLKAPPQGHKPPQSADEMRRILIELIPEARRTLIDVVVLDLSSGKPKN